MAAPLTSIRILVEICSCELTSLCVASSPHENVNGNCCGIRKFKLYTWISHLIQEQYHPVLANKAKNAKHTNPTDCLFVN